MLKYFKQWEEDDVVMQVLRYRIGIFKGQKAMMAAVYGYPKGGEQSARTGAGPRRGTVRRLSCRPDQCQARLRYDFDRLGWTH